MALPPDYLDENFDDISDWTKYKTGSADAIISPAGQVRFDSGTTLGSYARLNRNVSHISTTYTIQMRANFDNIGLKGEDYFYFEYRNTSMRLAVWFTSHLWISHNTDADVDVGFVTEGVWNVWRFEVTETSAVAATVQVFKDGVSLGTFDCSRTLSGTKGDTYLHLFGNNTASTRCHLDYFRIASGLGVIQDTLKPTDTIHLVESLSKTALPRKTISDAIHLVDVPKKKINRSRADAIGLASAILKKSNPKKIDTIHLADSLLKRKTVSTIPNSIHLVDSLTKTVSYHLAKSDSIHVSEVLSKKRNMLKSDVVSLSDSLLKKRGLNLPNPIHLSDAILKSERFVKSDSIHFVDNLIVVKHGLITSSIYDSVRIADVFSRTASYHIAKADSIHLADAAFKKGCLKKSDQFSISEILSKRKIISPIHDSIHILDALTKRVNFSRLLGDVVSVADVKSQSLKFSLSNTVFINDVFLRAKISRRAIADVISALDFFDKYTPMATITDFIQIEDDVHVWNPSMYKSDAFLTNDFLSKWKTPVLLYIEIINAPGSMTVGEAQQLTAIGFYDDDSQAVLTKLVTWVSSNQNVATIDSTGLVIIPVAQGSTFVTAYQDTVYGRIEKTIMVRVGMGDEAVSKLTEADISNLQLIPLDPSPNQTFSVVLTVDGRNINLQIKLRWNILARYWVMTIIDPGIGNYLVDGIVITTGVLPTINILQPYSYLGIGSCYIINVSGVDGDYPDEFNLGTDYIMLWGNTEV